jgi:hypothetical protein
MTRYLPLTGAAKVRHERLHATGKVENRLVNTCALCRRDAVREAADALVAAGKLVRG